MRGYFFLLLQLYTLDDPYYDTENNLLIFVYLFILICSFVMIIVKDKCIII